MCQHLNRYHLFSFLKKGYPLFYLILGLILTIHFSINQGWSLTPEEILVIANENVPAGVTLAKYYMKRREIPPENLIILSLTDQEHCREEEYKDTMARPIRLYLKLRSPSEGRYRCIVTFIGVPLAISEPRSGFEAKAGRMFLKVKRYFLNISIHYFTWWKSVFIILKAESEKVEKQIKTLITQEVISAVDSELALVRKEDYHFNGWVPNPYYLANDRRYWRDISRRVFIVSRLDGTSEVVVRRIIDDSLKVEEKGLRGKAYLDARWKDPGDKELSGYALYDRSIHKTAKYIKKTGKMKVVLNDSEKLFQPGECPNAALYCGWYSLGKYIDAFQWVPGSIGYHIASQECQTLRDPGSPVWCKSMLEKGVAATIGPVGEPYVQAFPPPDLFFKLLIEGNLSLGECFALSNPYLAWKMILIGDPLYRPFKYMAGSKATLHLSPVPLR